MSLCLLLVSLFTFVELNCENLFDTRHDTLKTDEEFLPSSAHHWTPSRYWRKLNHIGQDILSCGMADSMQLVPDMVALTEVENDSVMHDLTRRSLLRQAGYEYVMTDSPDRRGIDVALMWLPTSFRLIHHHAIRIPLMKTQRPTRDILYVSGELITGDTLHVFVVHAPSRSGGERATRPYRLHVARRLTAAIDSLLAAASHPRIIIAGDFNDYTGDASLRLVSDKGLTEISAQAQGNNGHARGTYRWHGRWGSLDHIFVNEPMARAVVSCHINDAPFLLEEEIKYGGMKPRRTYLGPRYLGGFSDHLPLVAVFDLSTTRGNR